MSGHKLSSDERRELTRVLRLFWQKYVQIVVQSRSGSKMTTSCIAPKERSANFNIEIQDHELVTQELKRCGFTYTSLVAAPYCIEISLRTTEGEEMVLEIWTLTFNEGDVTSARLYPTVYDRKTLLLKSALAVARITPAYRFSFNQDSLKIYYRLYEGKAQHETLGTEYKNLFIGKTNTPIGSISIAVSYRTAFSMTSSHRAAQDPIMLKSDHFTIEVSPKYYKKEDRDPDCAEVSTTSDESQDAYSRVFTASPIDRFSLRSRTSSESSSKSCGIEQKIYLPFAEQKQQLRENELLQEVPLKNLISSVILDNQKEEERKDSGGAAATSQRERGSVGAANPKLQLQSPSASCKPRSRNSSLSSTKSTSSIARAELDYVIVDIKMPFGGRDAAETDLKSFYHECKHAPDLSFESVEHSVEIENLSEQLKSFEANVDEYDELVKSLHCDSHDSSGLG